ncbi:MAG: SusD/RagB family nutrient-binding outer membrane lipoprotein [Bacteroidota bacterium]
MKTRIKILSFLLVTLLVIGSGCTKDFDTINTDPNSPSIDLAAPDMLLTNAIESMTDRVHEIFLGHEMGSCWAQHMAKVQYTDEDRYLPRVAVINNTWSSFYASSGMDIATLISIGESTLNDNYRGVGLVLQVYVSSVLTDLFGDIPYTQAWKGGAAEAILLPEYDSQADIYADMIAKLDTANAILDPDGLEISGDILFGNDIVLWKKFANSLKLRLLLRESGKVDVAAKMTEVFNDPDTYPIFESNADNAALQYLGSAPNNHPINENRKTRDDHRVSATLINLLYADAASPDYRVSVYANLADGVGDYVGLPNGMLSADAAAFNGNGLANTSTIGDYFTEATTPGMLMSYAELQFIIAEAAVKGYIPGGHAIADSFYKKGIVGSYEQYISVFPDVLDEVWRPTFESWGMTDEDIFEYALQDFKDWGGWWPLDTDDAVALEQIGTQRWVATFDQGLQSWFEWRRTGYPALTPAVDGVLGGKIPERVYYPSDEYARNNANVTAAAAAQGSSTSDLLTPVWWDVN